MTPAQETSLGKMLVQACCASGANATEANEWIFADESNTKLKKEVAVKDLRLESLGAAEFCMQVAEGFNITVRDSEMPEILDGSIQNICDFIDARRQP